jgi:hypothetical protein
MLRKTKSRELKTTQSSNCMRHQGTEKNRAKRRKTRTPRKIRKSIGKAVTKANS